MARFEDIKKKNFFFLHIFATDFEVLYKLFLLLHLTITPILLLLGSKFKNLL